MNIFFKHFFLHLAGLRRDDVALSFYVPLSASTFD